MKLLRVVVFIPIWTVWRAVDVLCQIPAVVSGTILILLEGASGQTEYRREQEKQKLILLYGNQEREDWFKEGAGPKEVN